MWKMHFFRSRLAYQLTAASLMMALASPGAHAVPTQKIAYEDTNRGIMVYADSNDPEVFWYLPLFRFGVKDGKTAVTAIERANGTTSFRFSLIPYFPEEYKQLVAQSLRLSRGQQLKPVVATQFSVSVRDFNLRTDSEKVTNVAYMNRSHTIDVNLQKDAASDFMALFNSPEGMPVNVTMAYTGEKIQDYIDAQVSCKDVAGILNYGGQAGYYFTGADISNAVTRYAYNTNVKIVTKGNIMGMNELITKVLNICFTPIRPEAPTGTRSSLTSSSASSLELAPILNRDEALKLYRAKREKWWASHDVKMIPFGIQNVRVQSSRTQTQDPPGTGGSTSTSGPGSTSGTSGSGGTGGTGGSTGGTGGTGSDTGGYGSGGYGSGGTGGYGSGGTGGYGSGGTGGYGTGGTGGYGDYGSGGYGGYGSGGYGSGGYGGYGTGGYGTGGYGTGGYGTGGYSTGGYGATNPGPGYVPMGPGPQARFQFKNASWNRDDQVAVSQLAMADMESTFVSPQILSANSASTMAEPQVVNLGVKSVRVKVNATELKPMMTSVKVESGEQWAIESAFVFKAKKLTSPGAGAIRELRWEPNWASPYEHLMYRVGLGPWKPVGKRTIIGLDQIDKGELQFYIDKAAIFDKIDPELKKTTFGFSWFSIPVVPEMSLDSILPEFYIQMSGKKYTF